jgi:L-ribulose-5-phosphate 3-epimerase
MGKKFTGFCVKCKANREIKSACKIVMKNAQPAVKGVCPVCGSEIFKVLTKEELENCGFEGSSFKIGVMLESLRLGIKRGIKKCSEMGVDGIQLYATKGELAPENLTKTGREDLLRYIKENGLEVSAVCGDLGGHGFSRANDNEWKIKKSKEILKLAKDLESNVVTTHVGVIPEDESAPAGKAIKEACEELGKEADNLEASFAIETGPEKAEILKSFLDGLKSSGVKVNYDPANLVMVTGDDPVRGVKTLKDYIVHTHAKDGIRVKETDPAVIYNYFADGGIGDLRLEDYFKEVPLGEGEVDFDGYIAALREICYNGYLTMEREVGDNPMEDIAKAVNFLSKY